jgi:hypothetical protein
VPTLLFLSLFSRRVFFDRVPTPLLARLSTSNNSEVADLLGDRSERMGKHYTRHVEAEANVIRAFTRVRDAK